MGMGKNMHGGSTKNQITTSFSTLYSYPDRTNIKVILQSFTFNGLKGRSSDIFNTFMGIEKTVRIKQKKSA
jgi:hypothetical protein